MFNFALNLVGGLEINFKNNRFLQEYHLMEQDKKMAKCNLAVSE